MRVDGREEERKKDGFSDCQKLSAASLPLSLLPMVVPFLFFQPALINEANQLAAEPRWDPCESVRRNIPRTCVEDITSFLSIFDSVLVFVSGTIFHLIVQVLKNAF